MSKDKSKKSKDKKHAKSVKPEKDVKKSKGKPEKVKKPSKPEKAKIKFSAMSEEDAASLTSKLFSIGKKLKAAGSEKEKKALYPKALKYIDKANAGAKPKQFPRLDKAYNRVFDRLPKDVIDTMVAA
jgi:hypothetical protein